MRKLFAKLHLWLSLPLGIIISIICLSGAALVFERDITQALQRSLYTVVPPSEDTQPLSPSKQLLPRSAKQAGNSLVSIPIQGKYWVGPNRIPSSRPCVNYTVGCWTHLPRKAKSQ